VREKGREESRRRGWGGLKEQMRKRGRGGKGREGERVGPVFKFLKFLCVVLN